MTKKLKPAVRRPLLAASVLIGILGMGWLVQGSYIYLKAILGQQLIQAAWEKTQITGRPQKPWPWADTWPLATLAVPGLGIEQVVLAGDSGQALAFGPGHRTGSALPGRPGTTLISGHRDTHFRFIGQLHPGDELALTTGDRHQRRYRVVDTLVVPVDFQLQSSVEEVLVLATCWPLGTTLQQASKRYLVFAVPDTTPDNPSSHRRPIQTALASRNQ